jgi:hypothetical protein
MISKKQTNAQNPELDYGKPDSVVYLNEGSIKPVTAPSGGYFTAEPQGLEIDPDTGVIDLTKSETGIRYCISYNFCDLSTKPVTTELTVSGVDCVDGIFSLSTTKKLPLVYNADAGNRLPNAEFDVCPDGTSANPATSEGLAIDLATGEIDLEKTIAKGALGNGNPKDRSKPINGASKEFEICYRLNDPSNKQLNRINIRLHYYEKDTRVPKYLRERLEHKKKPRRPKAAGIDPKFAVVTGLAILFTGGAAIISIPAASALGVLSALVLYGMASASSSSRPREIVVTN